MKKILLLGDSIRLGYDFYVRDRMKNIAEVVYPSENCRFSAYLYRHLQDWVAQLNLDRVDAVHFNAGLWDILHLVGDDRPLTDPEVYADYIERTIRRIRYLLPGAEIVFAATTPVDEAAFNPNFGKRRNCDIEAFNDLARIAAAKEGAYYNDLYALMKDQPLSYHSDATHFYTPEATEILGCRVTDCLCEVLGLDKSCLIPLDAQRYFGQKNEEKDTVIKDGKKEKVLGH